MYIWGENVQWVVFTDIIYWVKRMVVHMVVRMSKKIVEYKGWVRIVRRVWDEGWEWVVVGW